MKPIQSTLNFLEDSLTSLKKLVDGDPPSNTPHFDRAFMIQLNVYATELLKVCGNWNQDTAFIALLNNRERKNSKNNVYLKSELFLLSDFIVLFSKYPDTQRSRFVLAYFYDVLKNNHFADPSACPELNRLVDTPDFKRVLETIKTENTIIFADNNSAFSFDENIHFSLNQPLRNEISHWQNIALTFAVNTQKPKEKEKENSTIKSTVNTTKEEVEKEDTLEIVLEELNNLVGLENVKQDIKELINLVEVQKKRSEKGLKNIEISLHTVFLGPPGTGKTSVARLLGRIFKHLGLLSIGQMHETDREGLVAGYVGQTAIKVNEVITKSLGSVLFIDEAYALTQNTMGSDYGDEAVNILLKRMEDHRDDFVVVVAGYTEPMKTFIDSNPGLNSRFSRYFHFNHFTSSELIEIFKNSCAKSDFVLTEDASEKLLATFDLVLDSKNESFGNARFARNLFEKCVQNQANRVVALKRISKKKLTTIEEVDIPEPKDSLKNITSSDD